MTTTGIRHLGRESVRWRTARGHQIGYQILSGWLLVVVALAGFELISFYEDTEIYRRIYAHPGRLEAILWIYATLSAGAIAMHSMGWRTQRTSRLALTIVGLSFCLDLANVILALNPACFGTIWKGLVLQLWL